MHHDQNSALLMSPKRQLLQMMLNDKLGEGGRGPGAQLRTQSPASGVMDDVRGYGGGDGLGLPQFGPGPANLAAAHAGEGLAGPTEDGHLADTSQWGMLRSGAGMRMPQGLPAWAQPAGAPLDGSPGTELLGQQARYEEHFQDTEVDAPMASLQLHQLQQSLAGSEARVGSWPGTGEAGGGGGSGGVPGAADAALPFFPGKPIRTNSSSGGGLRAPSFNGSSHPTSAQAGRDGGGGGGGAFDTGCGGSFSADQLCFSAGGTNSSAPITPRSPSYNGYGEEDAQGMGFAGMGGPAGAAGGGGGNGGLCRHGPSKLRLSSSDAHTPIPQHSNGGGGGGGGGGHSLHGLPSGNLGGLDAFSSHPMFPGGAADQGPAMAAAAAAAGAANSLAHMALQQGAGGEYGALGGGPSASLPGSQPGSANGAAAAAAAAFMANLGHPAGAGMHGDPAAAAAAAAAVGGPAFASILSSMMDGPGGPAAGLGPHHGAGSPLPPHLAGGGGGGRHPMHAPHHHHPMMPPAGPVDPQWQALMYYAHLGMMASMHGGAGGAAVPGGGAGGFPPAGMGGPCAPLGGFPGLMGPHHAAALQQKQWAAAAQAGGMPASAIANIAAAAAAAATAASNEGEGGYHGSCSSSRSRGSGPRHHHGHGHHHAGADAYDAPGGGGGGAYGSGGGHHMLDRRPRSDSFRGPPGGVLGGGGGPAGAHHHALRGGGHSSSGRLELDMCGMGPGGAGAGVPGGRSVDPLLEEYKTNRTRKWEMRDILGHILEFSLDQLGSRFIQQRLDSLSPDELEAAFAEVAPKGLMLMNDVFGNYVIQKFLELQVDGPRAELAQQMRGQVLQLSLQLYSCRVIQKALEVLPLDQKVAMVAELDGHLMRCVRDQNGNHVVQKVIECVPTEHITGVLDTFSGSLVSLSQHPFGCRVMQRILEHCTDAARYNACMVEILKATVQLAQDQYGNYVIQHVVEQGRPHERNQVLDALFPHIVVLSQNKFASNVVEKLLLHCTSAQRADIVEAFLHTAASGGARAGAGAGGNDACGVRDQSPLEQMMQDQYGNYVVQKTLEVCDEGQRERLLSRVRCYYETLKTSTFGKHIVNRLEKLLSAGMRIQISSLPTHHGAAHASSSTGAPHAAPPTHAHSAGGSGLLGAGAAPAAAAGGEAPPALPHQQQQQQQQPASCGTGATSGGSSTHGEDGAGSSAPTPAPQQQA